METLQWSKCPQYQLFSDISEIFSTFDIIFYLKILANKNIKQLFDRKYFLKLLIWNRFFFFFFFNDISFCLFSFYIILAMAVINSQKCTVLIHFLAKFSFSLTPSWQVSIRRDTVHSSWGDAQGPTGACSCWNCRAFLTRCVEYSPNVPGVGCPQGCLQNSPAEATSRQQQQQRRW